MGGCPAGGDGSSGARRFRRKGLGERLFPSPPSDPHAVPVSVGEFRLFLRYPGPDGKFGPIHADHISEATQNFYGLDTDHDQDSKDDIVTAQMAIPVNREIHLLMHTKDVGHSF